LKTTGLIPTTNQQLPTTCTYTIHAASFFVCQLRLDFVRFSLPQPTIDTTTPGNAYPACNNGYLQVGNVKLCGENAGQHSEFLINDLKIFNIYIFTSIPNKFMYLSIQETSMRGK
jgi:hypothetical protein